MLKFLKIIIIFTLVWHPGINQLYNGSCPIISGDESEIENFNFNEKKQWDILYYLPTSANFISVYSTKHLSKMF